MIRTSVIKQLRDNSPLILTCLKSTMETLEKGVKYVNKLTMNTPEGRYRR